MARAWIRMRRGTALIVLAVVVAACGLVPPMGTRPVTYTVTNESNVPVTLSIKTPRGVLQGSAAPATLPPRGTARVTFFVPPGTDYWIMVNDTTMFPGADVVDYSPETCRGELVMQVNVDGSGGIGCNG